ncbi:hypothetical protein EBH_0014230 [Eimeria brunetti]|uniref:Chromo domain-containing protein n=1 Tax=Eimeria brunetti TaxID=51314 RepID=U6LEM1_9EIME|nr:hypothetical protein EBH_0014230 [Eimeria brunetti]
MAHFIPAKKSFTAGDTVELPVDSLIRYRGLPDALISDRDQCFQRELWQQLRPRFDTKRTLSPSYHRKSDKQTESASSTLEQMLQTYIQSDERGWKCLMPALELTYNTTSHSSTQLSPFEVMIEENALTTASLDSLVPNRHRASELVPQEAVGGQPPTRDAEGNLVDEYLVDYILDQRCTEDDAQYLVKWHGAPEDRATWGPVHHLAGRPALVRAWRRRLPKRQRARSPLAPPSPHPSPPDP